MGRELDFKNVVEPLIIKDIVNPLLLKSKKVTKKDIENLKKWISVWNFVGNSVWISVGNSVWISVGNSVGISIGISIGDSVRDSVGISVWISVWISVEDSVGAYISSFFNIKYDYDFSSLNELWNRGFVPSFDGTTWRLHSGKDAKIVYEMKGNKK